MEVGVRDHLGQHQAVMFHAAAFPQLLVLFGAKHFAERIGRIDRSIDQDVNDVNSLR